MNRLQSFLSKLVFLGLFCSGTSSLFAEYILYKTVINDEKEESIAALSEEEHTKSFKILMKYQFPMNLAFFHGIDQEDWTDDHYELLKDEQKFIQKKLDELDLDVKIAFIPTTLYELFFINFYFEQAPLMQRDESTMYFWESGTANESTYFVGDLLNNKNSVDSEYEQVLSSLNMKWNEKEFLKGSKLINLKAKNIHQKLNTKIIDYLSSWRYDFVVREEYNYVTFSYLTKKLLKKVHNLSKKIQELDLKQTDYGSFTMLPMTIKKGVTAFCIFAFDKLFSRNIKDNLPELIMLTCVKKEISAHKNNNHLLYRGSNKYAQSTRDGKNKGFLQSNSFGNSLFAGLMLDCSRKKGAMAYYFLITCDQQFVTTIDIADYCKKGEAYNIYYIAPYATITALGLRGEDFHSRSKVFITDDKDQISGKSRTEHLNKFYLQTLLVKNGNSQTDFEVLFQSHFNKNTLEIKQTPKKHSKKRKLDELSNKEIKPNQKKVKTDEEFSGWTPSQLFVSDKEIEPNQKKVESDEEFSGWTPSTFFVNDQEIEPNQKKVESDEESAD